MCPAAAHLARSGSGHWFKKEARLGDAGPRVPTEYHWTRMFELVGEDHQRGEVIWNTQTRMELYQALVHEYSLFQEDKVSLLPAVVSSVVRHDAHHRSMPPGPLP